MKNTIELSNKIEAALNTEKMQAYLKPMFTAAIAAGKIKNQEDMKNFQAGFVLSLIANMPELLKVIAADVYNELNK